MPPRFSYWTILLDGKPTAFRAAEQGELLPTFKRLQERHPDAVMRWFARGRLWSSPEEARSETARRAEAADAAARGRNWRPGGSHRDPRQPYKDAKKQRNQERRQRRFDYRAKNGQAGGANEDRGPKKGWNDAAGPGPREPKPWSDRPKPGGRWPRDERQDRPGPKTGGWDKRPARPRDDRLPEARPPKKDWSGPPAEGRREFKPWTDRPKPAGRWPRDERQGGPGPKVGGWNKRPAEPRDTKPRNKPGPQGGPPVTGDREPRKPWPNQGTPNQHDRPPLRGARPPSNRPPQSRAGDRPPFKGPRDSGFRGNGPSKGPRGPKR